ncbi:unnamed protein product [Aphanomyces euteiches]
MTVQETVDLEANEERVEQIVVCVLCCVRSRIIQLACVAFPSACLPGLVFWSQVQQDDNDAHRAHKILQAKKQERKVACGDESGNDKSMPNPFALCIEAAKTNNAQAMQWCLLKGQSPDETDHVRPSFHLERV